MRRDVRCFPRSDDAFASFVRGAVRELGGRHADHELAIVLRRRLATRHPAVAVRRADPLAEDHGIAVIYVFRDGSLGGPAAEDSELDDPPAATERFDHPQSSGVVA